MGGRQLLLTKGAVVVVVRVHQVFDGGLDGLVVAGRLLRAREGGGGVGKGRKGAQPGAGMGCSATAQPRCTACALSPGPGYLVPG